MALSEVDRSLLERCLAHQDQAWEDFVDRFLGLIVHVVNQTATDRSIRLTLQDTEDFVADVFLEFVKHDFQVLRRFRGKSSLATYLTVVGRRVIVRGMLKRTPPAPRAAMEQVSAQIDSSRANPEERLSNREEVERLLGQLKGPEADVIRMYHLEGKSYQEISSSVGMPENTIGPTLSRARAKIRSGDN